MKERKRICRSMKLSLTLLGALLAFGVVAAEEQPLEEIIVTATKMGREAVTKEVVGSSPTTQAPIERLTLAWTVAYIDLDLSRHSGAVELEKRIHARAKAVCDELDRLYPQAPHGGAACVEKAAASAMVQGQKLIDAAENKRPAG